MLTLDARSAAMFEAVAHSVGMFLSAADSYLQQISSGVQGVLCFALK